ncbi:uncharacterized protein LOC128223990 isoform X1 [Mya arenaria]|uniref:uncharacterized protein LOC128223990 isoform X1 n=1 Tax=Mya arenaria TaxID=6604 RepID=UPI0022E5D7F9|nr:uncharacterized protein LOC128223990 isoform X1 [Mya arenaria]XP_052789511.1 uncharacterized protein LOC128223990 isoform X1 [Mya arenaria]
MESTEPDQSSPGDEIEIPFCEPCKESKRDVKASRYCKECDEYLCEECTGNHQTQKMTKGHDTIDVIAKLKGDIIHCEPCKERNPEKTAQMFCPTCEEYLCNDCVETHKKMKMTKTHLPIPKEVVKEQSKLSDEVFIECEPCQLGNKRQRAKKYCHECNEYLCANCVILHKSTKITKQHVPEPIENLQKGPSSRKRFCNPCSDECQEEASMFCKACKEYLCETCVAYHRKQKATKDHTLSTDLSIGDTDEDKDIPCDVCKIAKTFSPSENFCTDCEENLCKSCTEVHLKRKITKEHKISKIEDRKLSNAINCTVCQDAGCSSTAVTYCSDCIEYICEKCMDMHQRHKLMKDHHLVAMEEMSKTSCQTCEKFEAVAYCMNCKEMICWQCRTKHNNTKIFKNHELAPVTKGNCDETNLFCELCEERDIKEKASAFCLDCDRTLLCSKCVEKHKARRTTQSHNVVMDLEKLEEEKENKDEALSDQPEHTLYSRAQASPKRKDENIQPGKPVLIEAGSDFIVLSWDPPANFQDGNYYQVSMKDVDQNSKWKFYNKEFTTASGKIEDIKSNTKFIFRVRVVHEHGEGSYSPESGVIITFPSPASRIVDFSTKVDGQNPTTYALPVTENRTARDETAKSRQFWLGSPPVVAPKEKTIMLIGATGTGKSTLVDGIVNYILGVNWDDPFRYTIIDLEDEEKQRETNQALSQTEWITRYTIFPEKGSRVSYCLNIIDTPGFGDTRGLQRDQEIVEQIRQLFSAKKPKGVCDIDAICFLIKAPDARLTAVQSYIFQSIMSLFGNDIEGNICSLITFADGIDPPVLAALKESNLPFGEYFTFNNSGLFARNVGHTSLAPMFWDMGIKSFQHFFSHLEQGKPKSLQLTRDVLDERFRLEQTVKNLQPQLDAGLLKVNQMKQEIAIIDRNKSTIKDNANFMYKVDETQQKKRELPVGQHVTNCTHCHFTCHENCGIPDDGRKKGCIAMDGNGFCTVCPIKCKWDKHANSPYIFDYVTVKVKKTYADMQKKYQEAAGKLLSQEQVIEKMVEELDDMIDDIEFLMTTVKECNERLSAIALRPNPLSMTEHIDLMIENEKLLKKDGFLERIHTLNEFRKKALIMSDATKFTKEAQTAMRNAGVKKKRDTPGVMKRIGTWFKQIVS